MVLLENPADDESDDHGEQRLDQPPAQLFQVLTERHHFEVVVRIAHGKSASIDSGGLRKRKGMTQKTKGGK